MLLAACLLQVGCDYCQTVFIGDGVPRVLAAEGYAVAPGWSDSCVVAESSNPSAATFSIYSELMRTGNDGPGSRTTETFKLALTAHAPGSAELILRHPQSNEVLDRATVTVFEVTALSVLEPSFTQPIASRTNMLIERAGADGSRFVGTGGLMCTATSPVHVAADCSDVSPEGTQMGSGTLSITAGKVTRDYTVSVKPN
jgi:hypothetical protein